MMVFCTECGSKLEGQCVICPYCGTLLKENDKPKMRNYNTIINNNYKTEQAQARRWEQRERRIILSCCILGIITIIIIMGILPGLFA